MFGGVMTMTIQILHRYSNAVLFEHDDATTTEAVVAAVAAGANLRGADLRGAYLEAANLGGAYLGGAYLEAAYLEAAYLGGATLKNGEKLIGGRPIFQVGPIGSRSDVLVAYITDQGLRLDAGCQRQITRDVFDARLSQTHSGNRHEREYRAALALIDVHAEIWTPTSPT